jgi:hypothetical protein
VVFRVLIWLNLYQAPEEQLAMIRNQSPGSILFGFALTALSFAAATTLWLLRRQAFPLFVGATALSIGSTVWQMFSGGPIDQMMGKSILMLVVFLFSFLLGWGMLLGICMYAWTLRERGVLQ